MRALTLAAGTALLGLAIPGWILPGAQAALVLDQQYLDNNGVFNGFSNGSGFRRAETFTVGVTGTLSVPVGLRPINNLFNLRRDHVTAVQYREARMRAFAGGNQRGSRRGAIVRSVPPTAAKCAPGSVS